MGEEQVVNTGAETPVAEPTQPETPVETTTESGAVEKQEPLEVSAKPDKTVPYDRFREVNQKAKEYERLYKEAQLSKAQSPEPVVTPSSDPYANMSAEEREQTKSFIDKFVLPEVQKRYEPFVKEVQTEKLNKQIGDAKQFSEKFGIKFDERLPEIVDYLSRPENKGRLTATEAVRNLYFDEITGVVKNKTTEEISRERDVLMEKKKQANTSLGSGVAPSAVVASDEMARRGMTPEERRTADIKWAIEQNRAGVKNPKVKSE